jgi:hypothetical protein
MKKILKFLSYFRLNLNKSKFPKSNSLEGKNELVQNGAAATLFGTSLHHFCVFRLEPQHPLDIFPPLPFARVQKEHRLF